MSTWGRAQDALYGMWESENGYGPPDDGPAKTVLAPHGVTERDWASLIEPIIERLAIVFGTPSETRERTP